MERFKLKTKITPFQCPWLKVLLSDCNLHCPTCTIPFEQRTLLKDHTAAFRTKVVNIDVEYYDVRIDRTTKWGNKFKEKEFGREKCIALYKNWILNNKKLLNCLPELSGKRLGCHCKPLACHGDILVELVRERCR